MFAIQIFNNKFAGNSVIKGLIYIENDSAVGSTQYESAHIILLGNTFT